MHAQGVERSVVHWSSLSRRWHENASLGDLGIWTTGKRKDWLELAKNWPQQGRSQDFGEGGADYARVKILATPTYEMERSKFKL